MAIPFGANIELLTTLPNFTRDMFATKAEMKAFAEYKLPDIFITTCKEDGNVYVFNKNNTVDAVTGKFRLFKSGGVEEVSELPENPDDNIYNVVSDKKIYEDLGSITTSLKYDDVYGGEMFINKTTSFVMDINGTEYNINPTDEAQYLIGDEDSFPRMAYVLYGTGDKIRLVVFTKEVVTYTFKAVTRETAANEVYSKDIKLVTQDELDNIGATAVLEKSALPSDIKNYVYKISSGDDSGAVITLKMNATDAGITGVDNAYFSSFSLPKDKILNINHLSFSYDGFNNRPYDWIRTDDGDYHIYNFEKNGDNFIAKALPAIIIYRESNTYGVYFVGNKDTPYYFETDASADEFIETLNVNPNESIVIPQDYATWGRDYNFTNSFDFDSDFEYDNFKYTAQTRTLTNSDTYTSSCFLKRKEKYINKLSSDSFNIKYNTWNVLTCDFSSEKPDSITVFGDEFTTDNDYYHNITDGSSAPSALPAYAYIKNDNSLFVWQNSSDGIFAKPSTNKIWYELDTDRDAEPMYIPSCVTRIKDGSGTIHSASSDFTYTDSSTGFTYVASTRMLTITGLSSDISIYFEVPATVGEMVIVNGTKVYAKDVEVVTKKEFDTYKESLPSFDPDKYVDKDSAQTVTGKKTFTNGVDANEVSHTDSSTSLKTDIKFNERLLFSAKKNDDHAALIGMTADASSSSIALSADSITLNNKNVVTSVDGVSPDANGNVASKFGGYEANFSTENTTGTWVPVLSNGKMQHRVIPTNLATLDKTVSKYAVTTMVGLGFTANSNVDVADFLDKIRSTYGGDCIVKFTWSNASGAYITDGTTTTELISGYTLFVGLNDINKTSGTWKAGGALLVGSSSFSEVYSLSATVGGTAGTVTYKNVSKISGSKVKTVDGKTPDTNGNVTSAFGNYTNDLSTENKTDTWVPVISNSKMQHRVIPAILTKTVNGISPDANGNIVTGKWKLVYSELSTSGTHLFQIPNFDNYNEFQITVTWATSSTTVDNVAISHIFSKEFLQTAVNTVTTFCLGFQESYSLRSSSSLTRVGMYLYFNPNDKDPSKLKANSSSNLTGNFKVWVYAR